MDSGPDSDSGNNPPDVGVTPDTGTSPDTGATPDSGNVSDSGTTSDGGQTSDGGSTDAGHTSDGTTGADAGDGGDATITDAHGSDSSSSGGGDGGAEVLVNFNIPPGLFPTLQWTISGPNTYSGVLMMGQASSIEFVAGGIQEADGYTLTLSGTDIYGGFCTGTSPPFNVQGGVVTGVSVTIICPNPEASGPGTADVTTGSVAVDAGVVVMH
jgi:hypothetical protein